MAIKLPQGFEITSKQPIDTRILLTKAKMLSTNDNLMPAKYIAICIDDGKFYVYDKSTTEVSETTGKFKLIDEQVLNNIRFTALETKVGDAESGLVKDVATAKQDITTIQGNITTIQGNVTQLQTDVATLQEEVEDPESGLAKKIQALETRASVIETTLNNLEPRIDQAEEDITELETRINNIKLENISGTISGEEVA